MEPGAAVEAFERFFDDCCDAPASAPLDLFIEVCLAFYAAVPVAGLLDPDGDALLFQAGMVDGELGRLFEIGVTRRFVTAGERPGDGPQTSQLRCVYRYDPTPALLAVPAASRWCRSRAALPDFHAFVRSSESYRQALREVAAVRTVEWSPV